MVRNTYGQVKDSLAEVAGATGMAVTDERLLGLVNAAVHELMGEGDWPGVVDRWRLKFDQATGLVVLPHYLERLVAVAVDDSPKMILSPYAEFVAYGPGPVRDEETDDFGNTLARRAEWFDIAADRGESAVAVDIPETGGPFTLRVVAAVSELVDAVAPVLNVQGLDPAGHPVRMTDGSGNYFTGENLDIMDGAGTDGTAQFASIRTVVKPATNGPVALYAVHGLTAVWLATYEFDETTPTFRRYYLPSLFRQQTGERDRVILGRCRRRFAPVTGDNDELLIGNELALAEMMIAQWKRRVGELDEYAAHKTTAVDILRKEAMAQLGKSRIPAITFQKGFALGSEIPAIR